MRKAYLAGYRKDMCRCSMKGTLPSQQRQIVTDFMDNLVHGRSNQNNTVFRQTCAGRH